MPLGHGRRHRRRPAAAGDDDDATTPPPATEQPATRADHGARAGADKPVYKKGWFWGVVVGGAVVVAGAITLGVLLSRPASEQALPTARF